MERKLRTNKHSLISVVILVMLILYTVLLFGLLGWSILASVHSDYGGYGYNYQTYYELPFKFELHYLNVFQKFKWSGVGTFYFEDILGNTLFYSIGSAFFRTIVPCLTAYACARYNFKTSKVIYVTCMIAMMVPIVGALPSEIRVAYFFHVGDTQLIMNNLLGTCLLKACMTGLYFFVMYSSFKSMPDDYFEAAKIDGAGNWQMLFKIGLPLIKNVFFTVFIINFVEFWNDYQTPMIYLQAKPTLGYVVWAVLLVDGKSPVNDEAFKSTAYAMTIVIMSALPIVTLFLAFKDKFMGSLTMGGIKG